MIKLPSVIIFLTTVHCAFSQFAPGAGQIGTSAVYKDSSVILNWASEIINFNPGPEDLSDSQSPTVSFGIAENALGPAEGNSFEAVSLGDGGSITLGFDFPIMNAVGPDFAVFENSFSETYLEFAFVEVSTNGIDYVRFPSTSNIQTTNQTGPFDSSDPTLVHNLAGKYSQGYGVPFDLSDLLDSAAVNTDSINFIRIVDVVGSIDSAYGRFDSHLNFINDPFPSPFNSSGFDLDGIAVFHQNNPLSLGSSKVKHFSLYPNPANEFITIKSNLDYSTYSVYNLQGQLILETDGNSQINLSTVPNGLYFMKLNSTELQQIERLVVQH